MISTLSTFSLANFVRLHGTWSWLMVLGILWEQCDTKQPKWQTYVWIMCLLFASEVPLGTRADTASQAANHHMAATSPDLDPQIHFRCCKCDDCSNAEHIPCLPVCYEQGLKWCKTCSTFPWVVNLKTLRQWNSKSITAEAIIATPHSHSKVVTISTGSISSKSIPWRVVCILFPICFCLYCLNTTRPSYQIHSALGWQIFKGNSYISKWHKKTETYIIICFSFPVQSRDLWTCGSCKSCAASPFYLQYLLANLLWWKNVGGSSIHSICGSTHPIWSSLFSSLTPVGSCPIRLSWPPISTTSRLGNINQMKKNRLKVWKPRKSRAPGCQNAQLSFTNSQVK